ncbi:hypothetical protein IH992_12420 [Candidatus Poribacteria bacterium]|nr:hypothetical protein [Candidatus Poribacteria bacterium]
MEITTADLEKKRIQEIAQEYQAKDYDVTVCPKQSQLPDFLADYHPHILARRDDETVVIEVKLGTSLTESQYLPELAQAIQEHSGWRLELVVINLKEDIAPIENANSLDAQDIAHAIRETKELLESHHLEAALLLAWSTAEATLRLLASKEEIPLRRYDALYLLKQLATYAAISREEYNSLMNTMRLRNAIAHGFKSEKFNVALVKELMETTNQLLQSISDVELG